MNRWITETVVKSLGLAFVAALLATSTHAAQLPDAEFSCQVRNAEGLSRLLNVQADTLERAKIVAAKSLRYGPEGPSAPLLIVVECIKANTVRFRDSAFREQISREVR